jgi:hypothetical protein
MWHGFHTLRKPNSQRDPRAVSVVAQVRSSTAVTHVQGARQEGSRQAAGRQQAGSKQAAGRQGASTMSRGRHVTSTRL